MAFAYVQSWEANGGTTGATGNTLTVSGATANNLLVAVVAVRFTASSASFNTPTGWTKISDAAGNLAGATYYRIASGTSADDFASTWSLSNRWAMAVAEYSGLATSSVFENSTENDTLLNSTTNPVSSGSVTPSTAGAAIAFLGVSYGVSWTDTDITIDSGFTKDVTAGQNVSARPAVAIASLDLSSTSGVNPAWTSGVAVQATYPVIAVFAEPSSGAYTLDILPATITVTGSALTLNAARNITPSGATVAVTGAALTLDADRTLSPTAATVAVTGGTLTLTYTTAGAYSLDPLPATVSVTGSAVTLDADRVLEPLPASVAVTGAALTLTYAPLVNKEITPLPATVAVTGTALTLTYGAINNYTMSPVAASVIVATKNLKLEYSGVNLSKINGVTI